MNKIKNYYDRIILCKGIDIKKDKCIKRVCYLPLLAFFG